MPAHNDSCIYRSPGCHPCVRHQTWIALASGADPLRQHFAGLQKGIGNQAILRTLSHSAPAIQTKLTVNQPGDPYEQEADRVADRHAHPRSKVSGLTESFSPTTKVLRKCSCGESGGSVSCPKCAEEKLQCSAHRPSAVSEAPPIVHEVIRSLGQPLIPRPSPLWSHALDMIFPVCGCIPIPAPQNPQRSQRAGLHCGP